MLSFKIEQIAISPKDPAAAKKLLSEMGLSQWTEDHVKAGGFVFGVAGENEANLSFNYEAFAGNEFEILDYTTGPNWMASPDRHYSTSHLGMHVSAAELIEWRAFFAEREIFVAQEVFTESHTNAYLLENGRKYNYVIFDTRHILGVDVKFIVRINKV